MREPGKKHHLHLFHKHSNDNQNEFTNQHINQTNSNKDFKKSSHRILNFLNPIKWCDACEDAINGPDSAVYKPRVHI